MFRKFLLLSFLISVFVFFSKAQETNIVYLSGTGLGSTVEWDFYCSDGANSKTWSKIGVPSQWELQGFGEYTYGRWYKQRGKSPSDETGHYKTTFDVPEDWKNKVVNIVFEGVMTDTRVLINGIQAGDIHQGGFYRFKYDITDKLKVGEENLLEVHVSKHSADRLVNAAERMADWWLFGGIYRPVFLEVLPESHIAQIKVDPKADGSFTGHLELENISNNASLRSYITDDKGKKFPVFETHIEKNANTALISAKWEGVKPWTPETPNLYTLTVELISKSRKIHVINERIGFRTVEVRPQDGIYVNGTKVVLKGVNRHTFWPEGGRCTNKEISVMDVKLIKEMNMNAVRAHYPPDKHFLDACDSLGLFFVDELAGWQNAYGTEIGTKLVREMIDRDVNHPSVILWSNGNEGGWNYDIDPLFEALDPQKRDVIHGWADFDDIDTHHYPQYQTGVHRFNNGEKIFMPTEFLHGLYDEGHGAGLDDFWAKWTSSPLFAGGFLWAYNDDAVIRTDLNDSIDSDGQHAPDGIVGPFREKEGSFFTIKEVWAPIQFEPLMITPSFKGEFLISNTYLYTNLNQCKMSYQLTTIPGPWEDTQVRTIAEGSIELPSILPGETRKVKMALPANFFDGDVLSISATDPFGKEIYTWTWPVRTAAQFLARKDGMYSNTSGKASHSEENGLLTLSAAGTSFSFSTSTGMIEKVLTPKGELPFNNGPVAIGMKAEYDRFESRNEGNNAVFTAWYKGGIDSIRWEMYPDGKVKMDMVSLNKATNDGGFDGGYVADKIDVWGITFSFPEDQSTDITWFGKGPYRVYKNRMKGTTYNLWQKDYNNTITGEDFKNLVYPEFKGYHANTYWASIGTKNNVPMTFASENNNLFLRLFTPVEPAGTLRRSLPHFPAGDLSFLYEINSIRAFKPTSQMGPNSEPSSIRIKKGDEGILMNIWFDFTNK
ncbi:glycoside hydrolase family 2 TIM barrel-domain containing protein [Roseimarinus sediminis]|uniref:glycoside hydrolase family 2 TIM barrel-domain containing protein n=1 Tax=Roseimarinus sediminis TaxID=1610899 RepID=UPI003D1926FC